VTVTQARRLDNGGAPLTSPPRPDRSPTGQQRVIAALPIAALILIPVAIFAGATLILGHPLLMGDNLIQGYPLRALVGTDLKHGSWPLWDPWIWSGTPLMAGLNAGALYPVTFLFAAMSPTAAWVLGQILVSSSISVGTYVFLLATGPGRLASFLGAASFAFAGAVAGQSAVHVDMAEGFASLPWMLLAVRHVIDDGRWRWTVLLGAGVACLLLAGSPEAILDVSILALAYGIVRWSLRPSTWRRLVTRAGAGFALGIGVSAFLWLPALRFIDISQRSSVSIVFASSYSFPPRSFVLGLVPFLEGGWGLVSQPSYFGRSNLGEVALYVGLLPFVAAVAVVGRRWAEWLPIGERRTWYFIGLVGIVLAVGAGTPLEHLIIHIPIYGKQRDEGRNIVDVDFAACVLLAWWLDGGRRPEGARTPSETIAAGIVFTAVVGVLVWLVTAPASLWRAVAAYGPSSTQLRSIETAAVISALLAAGAAALVLARPRLRRSRWLGLAAVFVVIDVGLFASGTTFATSQAPPSASALGPLLQMVQDSLSPDGRYALYDPDLLYYSAVVDAGEPDVGILAKLPSVEGYGSIVGLEYSSHTGTHLKDGLAANLLDIGYFQHLDLQVMVAPAEEFLTPIAAMPRVGAPANLSPIVERSGVDPLLPAGNYLPPQARLPLPQLTSPRAAISRGGYVGWYFGTLASPNSANLVLSRPAASQLVRVGEIAPSGAVSWQRPQRLAAGASTVSLDVKSLPSAGIEVQLLSGPDLGPSQLTLGAEGHAYVVNGVLAPALTPGSWTYVGQAEHFAVYRADYVPQRAWVQAHGTYAISPHLPAGVRVLSQSTDTAVITVRSPRPSMLLRSEAWDSGWQAEIVSGQAASEDLAGAETARGAPLAGAKSTPVLQVGVVQAVDIPAGLSIVRFSYKASGLSRGLTIAGGTLAAGVLGFALFVLAGRRRRRRQQTPEPWGGA
jgi:hypothetical protein